MRKDVIRLLKFRLVTFEEYMNLNPKDNDTLYYIIDSLGLMRGDQDFNAYGIEIVVVEGFEFIEDPSINTLYVNRNDLSGKIYNGENFIDVIMPISSISDLLDLEISPDLRVEVVVLSYNNETKIFTFSNITSNKEHRERIATTKKVTSITVENCNAILHKVDGSVVTVFLGANTLVSGINLDGKVVYKHPMIGDVFTDYSLNVDEGIGSIVAGLTGEPGNILVVGPNGEPESSVYSISNNPLTGSQTAIPTENSVKNYVESEFSKKISKAELAWITSLE